MSEADSLLHLIDGQELRIRELEIDLWEQKALSQADSTLAAERLDLTERTYERIIEQYRDEQDSWFQRALKSPVVWLALGMWIGVQAGQ